MMRVIYSKGLACRRAPRDRPSWSLRAHRLQFSSRRSAADPDPRPVHRSPAAAPASLPRAGVRLASAGRGADRHRPAAQPLRQRGRQEGRAGPRPPAGRLRRPRGRVAREILSVGPATDPMQVALLVDNSQAATRAIQFLRDGARRRSPTRSPAHGHSVVVRHPRRSADAAGRRDHRRRRAEEPGHRPAVRAARLRHVPARGADRDDEGLRQERHAAPGDRRRRHRGQSSSATSRTSTVIEALRDSGAQFYALVLTEGDRGRPVGRRGAATATSCSTAAPGERAAARDADLEHGGEGRLKTLASELLDQVRRHLRQPRSAGAGREDHGRRRQARRPDRARRAGQGRAARAGRTERWTADRDAEDCHRARRRGRVATLALVVALAAQRRRPRRPQPAPAPPAAPPPTPAQPAQPQTAGTRRRRSRPRRRRSRRPRSRPAQRPSFRGGVDVVSLNVTVTDSRATSSPTSSRATSSSSRTASSRTSPTSTRRSCRSRCRCSSTPAPAWRTSCGSRRKRRSASSSGCSPTTSRRSSTSTAASRSCSSSPPIRPAARDGDPPDRAERLDLAAQRDLHLAEGAEEGPRARTPRTCAARRSSCCRTARTPRAWCRSRKCSSWPSAPRWSIYTIGIRGRDFGARGFNEAEFVLQQFAQETGGRAFFPTGATELRRHLRADRRRARGAVRAGLLVAQPAARRPVAPHRRPHHQARARGAHQAGLLRPDELSAPPARRRRCPTPSSARDASSSSTPPPRRALRRALRPPAAGASGRAATARSAPASWSHTFLLGHATVQVGDAAAGRRRAHARVGVRLAAGDRLPLRRADHRRAGDGRCSSRRSSRCCSSCR